MITANKTKYTRSILAELLGFAVLIGLILLPGQKQVQTAAVFLAAAVIMEGICLFKIVRAMKGGNSPKSVCRVMTIIWCILIAWEVLVTKLNLLHPVLYPAPENVFCVFYEQRLDLLQHIASSLELLLISVLIGMGAAVIAGSVAGWRLEWRGGCYPIANVLAPIPAVVYAPYIISLMPSFRSASAAVVALGVFFPMFLNVMNQVSSMDSEIVDSARMLNVKEKDMVTRIILPYLIPGIISGMKVTLTTAFMLLMFAEMMGATRGLGYYIVNYNTYGNYTNVVAGIIMIGIIVTILNWFTSVLQRRVVRWR